METEGGRGWVGGNRGDLGMAFVNIIPYSEICGLLCSLTDWFGVLCSSRSTRLALSASLCAGLARSVMQN